MPLPAHLWENVAKRAEKGSLHHKSINDEMDYFWPIGHGNSRDQMYKELANEVASLLTEN